jgi:hypothetical protein
MMDVLDRNATCPMCGKFYHRIDVHKNPIPTRTNQRTEESLCSCAKGASAREYRRQVRLDMDRKCEVRNARRQELLTLGDKNRAFWTRIQGGDK